MINVKIDGSASNCTIHAGEGDVHVNVQGDVSGLNISGGDVSVNGKRIVPGTTSNGVTVALLHAHLIGKTIDKIVVTNTGNAFGFNSPSVTKVEFTDGGEFQCYTADFRILSGVATCDWRPTRLNVTLDEHKTITNIRYG
jgi:hypothetical protein